MLTCGALSALSLIVCVDMKMQERPLWLGRGGRQSQADKALNLESD